MIAIKPKNPIKREKIETLIYLWLQQSRDEKARCNFQRQQQAHRRKAIEVTKRQQKQGRTDRKIVQRIAEKRDRCGSGEWKEEKGNG